MPKTFFLKIDNFHEDLNYLKLRQNKPKRGRMNPDLERIILEYLDIVDIPEIRYPLLSKKYFRKINWYRISQKRGLSEKFIRYFSLELDWIFLSFYQNFSEDFVEEFEEKIYWPGLWATNKYSEKFVLKYVRHREI